MDDSIDGLINQSMHLWMDQWIDGYIDGSINGCVDRWIVAHFTKGARIKAWGQWSVEEEEDEGRGKWEGVRATI